MRIACLPLAGPHNPYQKLLKLGLGSAGHTVVSGAASSFFPLTKTVLQTNPGAIHLDWPGSYYLRSNPVFCIVQALFFWLDIQIFKFLNVPLVWTVHNLTEHETRYPKLDRWAKRQLAALAIKIRTFADRQVAEAASVLQVSPDKIIAVPEGSYVGHYPETQSRQDARYLLGLTEGGRVILHFGNLRPYKGSIDLVKAFKEVASPLDRLVMAGPAHNPAYVEALKESIEGDKRVLLHPGFVDEPRVQTYFMAADVAAFPFARIDNSGTVILAMGFGLPCIAPAVGAVSGRLKAQPHLLFEPGHLAETIKYALTEPLEDLQAIGRQNRAQVLSYSWEDFGQVFDSLPVRRK